MKRTFDLSFVFGICVYVLAKYQLGCLLRLTFN